MEHGFPTILWDLDGTILSVGSDPGRPFERALLSVGRTPPVRRPELHGKTDLAICRDYLRLTDLRNPERLSLARQLLHEVERVTTLDGHTLLAERHVLPGVIEVLRSTSARGVRHGLATGNSRVRAEFKLKMHNLLEWFDMSMSAFGSETTERAELLALAASRRLLPEGPDKESASVPDPVVFGDTPADIVAAKVHGFPVVGISTGAFSEAALRAAGASLVVPTLHRGFKQVLELVLER
ncbi:MAG: haloacid dehalogenase-like hydrolase [Actinomycetota bacterium]|nr:haloacid dehalogenase-like hydrolase [Actinomycetota bacterium]